MMLAAVAFTGCGTLSTSDIEYDDADKYTAGDREITDKIDSIEIEYVAGDIEIKSEGSGKVTVKETSSKDLEEDQKIHTWVTGTTLKVKYCASGVDVDLNDLDKELLITVPKDFDLADIDIDSAAGNLKIDRISVQNLDIDMAAGDLDLIFAKVPKTTDIDAAAGDVTITIPEDSGLTIESDTAVGGFSCEIPFITDNDKEEYILGDGSNELSLDAAAGDIKIKKL